MRLLAALLVMLLPSLSCAAEAPENGLPSAYEIFVLLGLGICAAYLWIAFRRKNPRKSAKQPGS